MGARNHQIHDAAQVFLDDPKAISDADDGRAQEGDPVSKRDILADFAIDLRALGYPEPVTEYPFAKSIGRRFRFDLAWPDQMLAVEIDGATWTGGRHVTGAGYERDCIKCAEAVILGWKVIRVTMSMIRDGTASDLMARLRDV